MRRCVREGLGVRSSLEARAGERAGKFQLLCYLGTIEGPFSASPLLQTLVAKKGLGSKATECLGSPLPPAHSPGFTLGQLESEVAFKQLD